MATEKAKETTGEKRVPIFIPRGQQNGDPNFYVSVNNYTAVLPRGKESEVPEYVAEEIKRALAAEDAFYALVDKLKN